MLIHQTAGCECGRFMRTFKYHPRYLVHNLTFERVAEFNEPRACRFRHDIAVFYGEDLVDKPESDRLKCLAVKILMRKGDPQNEKLVTYLRHFAVEIVVNATTCNYARSHNRQNKRLAWHMYENERDGKQNIAGYKSATFTVSEARLQSWHHFLSLNCALRGIYYKLQVI